MKAFVVLTALIAVACCWSGASALYEDFSATLDTLNTEVKAVAGGAIPIRLNFAQLGASNPKVAGTWITDLAYDASISDFLDTLSNYEYDEGCVIKTKPTAYAATSKGTEAAPNIVAPIVVTCANTGEPIKSVTFYVDGQSYYSGTCVNVAATSAALPVSTYTLTGSKVMVDGTATVSYTTSVPVVVAGSVDLTALVKLPFVYSAPPPVDVSKAGAFFTGVAAATTDIAGALVDSFNTASATIYSAVSIRAFVANQPCTKVGLRDIAPDYPIMSAYEFEVTNFNTNGVNATDVYVTPFVAE